MWRSKSPLACPMLPAAVSTVCLGCMWMTSAHSLQMPGLLSQRGRNISVSGVRIKIWFSRNTFAVHLYQNDLWLPNTKLFPWQLGSQFSERSKAAQSASSSPRRRQAQRIWADLKPLLPASWQHPWACVHFQPHHPLMLQAAWHLSTFQWGWRRWWWWRSPPPCSQSPPAHLQRRHSRHGQLDQTAAPLCLLICYAAAGLIEVSHGAARVSHAFNKTISVN